MIVAAVPVFAWTTVMARSWMGPRLTLAPLPEGPCSEVPAVTPEPQAASAGTRARAAAATATRKAAGRAVRCTDSLLETGWIGRGQPRASVARRPGGPSTWRPRPGGTSTWLPRSAGRAPGCPGRAGRARGCPGRRDQHVAAQSGRAEHLAAQARPPSPGTGRAAVLWAGLRVRHTPWA